jgi:GNAT superfamily N-acetyltransferase
MIRDRDLLGDADFQARWGDVVARTAAATRKPFRVFSDKGDRPFSIYLAYGEIAVGEADEQDRDALQRGLDHRVDFGAVSDANGLCYGAIGLYFGEDESEVTERSLEVDLANRRLGIGSHLYWAAMAFCAEAQKTYAPSRRDTVVGQLFGEALKNRDSPYAGKEET